MTCDSCGRERLTVHWAGPLGGLRLCMDCYEKAGPPPQKEQLSKTTNQHEVIWTSLGDVDPRSVLWLWKPYIPLGKVTLVAGAPGHGKSQLTAMFAAFTTRGGFYPSDLAEPGRAVIVSSEDDIADTIVPRLMAANADVPMVETVNIRTTHPDGLTTDGLIRLPGDIEVLHRRLKRGDVRLVVFDPVVSFFARDHKTVGSQDVRDVLDPLRALAEVYSTSVVIILHLNKASEAKEWSARIAESHGFQAAARSILALGPDPEDEDGETGTRKVLALPKSSLAKRAGTSWRLEVKGAIVFSRKGVPIETSKIEFVEPCDVSADDLLMGREQTDVQQAAREFLEDFLGDEWRKVGDVQAAAIKAGHSWRTIERVRKTVCQRHKEAGVKHGAWWIALKTVEPFARARAQGTVALGDVGGLDANSGSTPSRPPKAGVSRARGGLDENGHQPDDLEWYRRQRDAQLGERWEDE